MELQNQAIRHESGAPRMARVNAVLVARPYHLGHGQFDHRATGIVEIAGEKWIVYKDLQTSGYRGLLSTGILAADEQPWVLGERWKGQPR